MTFANKGRQTDQSLTALNAFQLPPIFSNGPHSIPMAPHPFQLPPNPLRWWVPMAMGGYSPVASDWLQIQSETCCKLGAAATPPASGGGPGRQDDPAAQSILLEWLISDVSKRPPPSRDRAVLKRVPGASPGASPGGTAIFRHAQNIMGVWVTVDPPTPPTKQQQKKQTGSARGARHPEQLPFVFKKTLQHPNQTNPQLIFSPRKHTHTTL